MLFSLILPTVTATTKLIAYTTERNIFFATCIEKIFKNMLSSNLLEKTLEDCNACDMNVTTTTTTTATKMTQQKNKKQKTKQKNKT